MAACCMDKPEEIFVLVIQGDTDTVAIPCRTHEIARKNFIKSFDAYLDEKGLTKDDVDYIDYNRFTYNECIDECVFCCEDFNLRIDRCSIEEE